MAIKKLSWKQLELVWSKEAKNYSILSEFGPDYVAYFQVLSEVIGDLQGKRIADIGSGTAIVSGYFAEQGADLTLIDISDEALKFGRNYFVKKKLKGKFLKQNAFTTKLPENYFDVVWNGGVIEHFVDKDKVKMIEKMWSLVKTGGMLLITAPNARDIPFMLAKQLLILRKKWSFGEEDNLTQGKMNKLARFAGITNLHSFCFNPIVGWWFFPYGKEVTTAIGLNRLKLHKTKCPVGHNIVFWAVKN